MIEKQKRGFVVVEAEDFPKIGRLDLVWGYFVCDDGSKRLVLYDKAYLDKMGAKVFYKKKVKNG